MEGHKLTRLKLIFKVPIYLLLQQLNYTTLNLSITKDIFELKIQRHETKKYKGSSTSKLAPLPKIPFLILLKCQFQAN